MREEIEGLSDATRELTVAYAACSRALMSHQQVVDIAVQLLVGGCDTPEVAVLAGIPSGQATSEVPRRIREALSSLGVDIPLNPVAEETLAFAAVVDKLRRGQITRKDLTTTAHESFGHVSLNSAISRIADVDDIYDLCLDQVTSTPTSEIDARLDGLLSLFDESEQLALEAIRPAPTTA